MREQTIRKVADLHEDAAQAFGEEVERWWKLGLPVRTGALQAAVSSQVTRRIDVARGEIVWRFQFDLKKAAKAAFWQALKNLGNLVDPVEIAKGLNPAEALKTGVAGFALVVARLQPLTQQPRQCPQPPVNPERLDARDRFAVHPGRPAVAADRLPGDREHVVAPHLVAQRVEPEARSFLRFACSAVWSR